MNVQAKLDEIRNVHSKYSEAIAKVQAEASKEWIEKYGMPMHISPEAVERNKENAREFVGELMKEYKDTIQRLVDEGEATLSGEKRIAIQEYAAAEHVPTQDDLNRMEVLKREYNTKGIFDENKFMFDCDFHMENQTVFAYPYYLMALERVKEKGDEAAQKALNDKYVQLYPELGSKAAALDTVEAQIRAFRIGVINFRFDTEEVLKTHEGWEESVRLKGQLLELGYYGNAQ